MDRTPVLAAAEQHWIAKDLVSYVVPVSATLPVLMPEEVALVAGATPRRRAQFAAGRDAARRAMVALGMPAVAVAAGAGGEPLFPAGLHGSISHTRDHAVALVGRSTIYGSVGVDIDDVRPLGDVAAVGVTWEVEVARIQRVLGLSDRAAAQNFAFSAKEAVYKCQYPLTADLKLRALQARLLEGDLEAGEMAVSGWRVASATAGVLARIAVRRLALRQSTLAVAVLRVATAS